MSSTKATKPAADLAGGPRGSGRLGNRIAAEAIQSQAKKQDGPRVSLSPMESAFLAGLVDLAQRGDTSIAPADDVEPGEIRRAIHALVRARGGDARR